MYATYILLIRTQSYSYFLAKGAVQAHETGREAAAFNTWWSLSRLFHAAGFMVSF